MTNNRTKKTQATTASKTRDASPSSSPSYPGFIPPHGGYPICLGGARACPPEDCGGVPGYFQLLEAFRNPSRENEELREWAGGEFDPEAFDADAVNRRWSGQWKHKRR